MVAGILLAAGKGTRMKSSLPKVLHTIGNRALIEYAIAPILPFVGEIVVVVGYKAELVKNYLTGKFGEYVKFAYQREQLGTADAVKCALDLVISDVCVVVPGDMPMVREESIKRLIECLGGRCVACVLAARVSEPHGYGRVIEDKGFAFKIVEEMDATEEERKINLVNTGVYAFRVDVLREALKEVKNDNAKGEYYLTDVVEIINTMGYKVKIVECFQEEGMGVNSRKQLSEVYLAKNKAKIEKLMEEGVTVLSPEHTFIDEQVKIGRDTVIYPFVFVEGDTVIGEGCIVYPFSVIRNSRVGNGVTIYHHSVIEDSQIEDGVSVGPFARLRPGTLLREGARIGNFVEVKKSVIGKNSKANHLSYIGDAVVGDNVNIGAGTITCNYDGVKKHQTIIEDGVFIGSDTQLVAPVKVGRGALIGAGSTITKDVPPDSLAVSRAPMKVLKGRGIKDYKKRKYGIAEE